MSVKNSRVFFLIMLFSIMKSFGQSQVRGKVVDSLDNKPVDYAVINFYKSGDSSLLGGRVTDSTGVFVIEDIKEGVYDFKVSGLSYSSITIKNIVVTKEKSVELGNVVIQSNQQEEVVITGQREVNKNKLDKQVYKAGQFDAARGGSAIDVLKNMPSISVNGEGEIRYRGSAGFLVLLNGKPVITDAYTVLAQLPANSIENIELITAPSAKYDADGKAGIINIVTKKGTDNGLSYTVNLQYGLPSVNDYDNINKPDRYGADWLINYKKNAWDFSFGGSYQQNDIAGRRDGNVNTTVDNRYTSFPSIGERSFQRRNYSARASVIYSPNKNNSISLGAYRGQRRQYRRADINYSNVKTDITTEQNIGQIQYFNSNLVKKQGDFSLVNLDYSYTFVNKSIVTISGLYEHALLDGYTKNLNSKLNSDTDTLDYVLNTGGSPLDGIRGKVDYIIPIGKGKLESGYQFRYQKQTGEFLYKNAILGTGQYEVVPEFSANINVTNQIQGLYTQYSGKYKKLDYIGGLRYEYSTRVFDADKLDKPYSLYLSNLFPSANLLYNWKDGLKVKGGFSRRVQRSTSNELNPYPEREHSETLEQGDPDIRPEFVNLTELGVIKDLKKNSSVFVTLYNQQIDNVVNRVNSVYNDTILNRIYTNAGQATLWGIESGINLKPIKWWSIYAGGNLYDYKIRGSLFNNSVAVNNSGIVYSFNTNQNFTLTKTVSVQFNLNYISKRPTAQGEDSRFASPNLSVKKTLWGGKANILVQWQNIGLGVIKSNEQRISTWGNNFYTTTNYIQEKDVFWVNFSYNFKQSNKKFKLPTSEFGEKEF